MTEGFFYWYARTDHHNWWRFEQDGRKRAVVWSDRWEELVALTATTFPG